MQHLGWPTLEGGTHNAKNQMSPTLSEFSDLHNKFQTQILATTKHTKQLRRSTLRSKVILWWHNSLPWTMAHLNHSLVVQWIKNDCKTMPALTHFMRPCARKPKGQRWDSTTHMRSLAGDSGRLRTEAETSGNSKNLYSSLKFCITESTNKANNSIQKWKEIFNAFHCC